LPRQKILVLLFQHSLAQEQLVLYEAKTNQPPDSQKRD
jgi:hypothetical protein